MADFITVPFDAEIPEEIQQRFFAHVQAYFPEWEPHAGSLEVAQTEILAQIIYELTTLAADVPLAIFQYLGNLIRISPDPAIAATVLMTFAATDALGHTLPADTLVAWEAGTDTGIGFYTTEEVVIPPLSTTADVLMRCEVEGFIGNGFSGSPQLISLLDWVDQSALVAVAPTAGGQDQENLTDYLNRLSRRLQLLKDRPIRDFEVEIWAATVMNGIVGRAICFDNYNGDTNTPDQERHCTIVSHDLVGADLTTPNVAVLMAGLALTREINFNFHYKHPTRTLIDVKAAVVAEPGWDLTALIANVKFALAQVLDPLAWGLPSSAQGPRWQNTTVVRRNWIYSQVSKATGVRYVDESVVPLQIRANGGAWTTADINLTGLAPLVTSDTTTMDITAVAS